MTIWFVNQNYAIAVMSKFDVFLWATVVYGKSAYVYTHVYVSTTNSLSLIHIHSYASVVKRF